MNKQPSVFGGACIIAGVCVGAGMLALPSAGAGAWTVWSGAALVITMMVMTLSGWLLLESYQHYDRRASFNTVTREVLGQGANIINNLAVYFVGGILLYAYITSLGGIFHGMLPVLPEKVWSVLACVLLGGFVFHSTRAVDRISVLLIVFMALSFVFAVSGLTLNISPAVLFDQDNPQGRYAPYVMMFLPAALASFGYHHSVTSMRAYYGEERKAARAILYGMLIALAIYLVWLWSIFGNLPRTRFAPVIEAGGDVSVLLQTLGGAVQSAWVKRALDAFAAAAVISSFIGVGLGLFDYLADLFGFADDRAGRAKTWCATFLPPLVLSLLFPLGFLIAIGYAGAVAAVWTCIIPALLVWQLRRQNRTRSFVTPGGNGLIVLTLVFGIAVAVFHFLHMFKQLPVFGG